MQSPLGESRGIDTKDAFRILFLNALNPPTPFEQSKGGHKKAGVFRAGRREDVGIEPTRPLHQKPCWTGASQSRIAFMASSGVLTDRRACMRDLFWEARLAWARGLTCVSGGWGGGRV